MLELRVLQREMAGLQVEARHFPFRLGRAVTNDWVLEKSGVWEEHAEIVLRKHSVFVSGCGEARVRLNGQLLEAPAELRSGDVVEVGSVSFRVALERKHQKKTARQFVGLAGLVLGITALQAAVYLWLSGQ
jgi:predicted component of type VI protein secretion system